MTERKRERNPGDVPFGQFVFGPPPTKAQVAKAKLQESLLQEKGKKTAEKAQTAETQKKLKAALRKKGNK